MHTQDALMFYSPHFQPPPPPPPRRRPEAGPPKLDQHKFFGLTPEQAPHLGNGPTEKTVAGTMVFTVPQDDGKMACNVEQGGYRLMTTVGADGKVESASFKTGGHIHEVKPDGYGAVLGALKSVGGSVLKGEAPNTPLATVYQAATASGVRSMMKATL
jgi:hypothetical protein